MSPWKKSHLSPQRVPGEFPHFNTLNGAQQPGQRASYYIGDPFAPDKTRQFVAATFAQPAFPLTFHYHLLFFSSSLVKIEIFFVFFAFCLCLKPFSSCLRELMTIFLRLELKKFFFSHLIKMPANYYNHRPQMLNYIGQSLLKCVFLQYYSAIVIIITLLGASNVFQHQSVSNLKSSLMSRYSLPCLKEL